jgi:hypothetical protein
MELLQAVHYRKLVTRNHLEIILPSFRYVGSRTRMINRAINKLFHSMCLDKAHEKQEIMKGNAPCTVALDKGGSILLGVPHKPRITHERINIKGTEYLFRKLPSNYRHINGVNQCEVDTILFCDNNEAELIQWVLEKPLEFHSHQEKTVIIPDVFLEVNMKTKPLFAYLEYDTGSENARFRDSFPIINSKLVNYKKYKASKLWKDYAPYFPIILLVTEDRNRIDYFKVKCKEYGLQGYGVYYESYDKFLRYLYDKV